MRADGFSRDEAGFAEFVATRGAALGRTAYLLTGDHHLAEDLLQTALVQAARQWERVDNPEAYVRRALYHQNVSWWRRRRLREVGLSSYDVPAAAGDPDLRLTLEQALATLTVKQRTVLVLRFFEDLTEVQTAALTRVGDQAPTVAVPADTWQRGRRARARGRALTGATLVALVAVLGTLVMLLPTGGTRVAPAVPGERDTQAQGIPAQFWTVPDRLVRFEQQGLSWDRRVVETDLALGTAAAAFPTGHFLSSGLPVIVTTDGRYHPVVLPGYLGADTDGSRMIWEWGNTIALSPDGTKLAYGYGSPAPGREDHSPVSSGIRVLHLATGAIRQVDLMATQEEGQAVLAADLRWSPDGKWLAWQGSRMLQWNASGSGAWKSVGGVVAPDAETSTAPPVGPDTSDALAVDDDGTVTTLRTDGRMVRIRDGRVLDRSKVRMPGKVTPELLRSLAAPDGRHVLLGKPWPGRSVEVLDTRSRQVLRREIPDDQGEVTTAPLGWIGADLMVVQVTPVEGRDGNNWTDGSPQVVVMSAPWVPREQWTYRIVSRWQPDPDQAAPRSLTVATGLMTLEHPTFDGPQPAWPWSTERRLGAGALALLALLLGGWLVVRVARSGRMAG